MPQKSDHAKDQQKINNVMLKIKHKILVLSNKGGVGKSTVSANLALALMQKGYQVGLLDADLHGPSQAKIFGIENVKFNVSGTPENIVIEPLKIGDNLKLATTAAIIDNVDSPLIWRGPLKMSIIKQFLADVLWGELDFLVIDSPPGTGDEPLTILQMLPSIDFAVVVTTPQEMAVLDSRKAVNFVKQFKIPHVGIVENMAAFTCPHCGGTIEHFSKDGGKRAASEMGVEFLGSIPFDDSLINVMEQGTLKDNDVTKEFTQITEQILSKIKKNEN